MDPLIDPGEYAALAYCTYLNQASLGLIPRTSLEASVRFLTDVAQHGNLRLSDQAEARILDGLRTAAAELLGAPVASVAVVGGASEGLGQLAALLSSAGGEVVLVSSDFPSVTYPWLAARDRLGMHIRWVRDTPVHDLTLSLSDAIGERTTVVCVSPVQFATGSRVDVAALVARARDVGARVVVDVTQMAGAAPVTMTQGSGRAGLQRLQVAVRAVRRCAARHYREPGGSHPRDRWLERQRHTFRLHPAGTLSRR